MGGRRMKPRMKTDGDEDLEPTFFLNAPMKQYSMRTPLTPSIIWEDVDRDVCETPQTQFYQIHTGCANLYIMYEEVRRSS